MMNRRGILKGAAVAAVVPLLSACSNLKQMLGSTTVLPSSQLAIAFSDVSAIAGGLASTVPTLKGIPGAADAITYINDIGSVAAQMANVTTQTAAQPFVLQLQKLINSLIATVTPLVANLPTIGPLFQDAAILLPVIETAVGLVIAAAAPDPSLVNRARLELRAASVR